MKRYNSTHSRTWHKTKVTDQLQMSVGLLPEKDPQHPANIRLIRRHPPLLSHPVWTSLFSTGNRAATCCTASTWLKSLYRRCLPAFLWSPLTGCTARRGVLAEVCWRFMSCGIWRCGVGCAVCDSKASHSRRRESPYTATIVKYGKKVDITGYFTHPAFN
jgi:hypothetical protein